MIKRKIFGLFICVALIMASSFAVFADSRGMRHDDKTIDDTTTIIELEDGSYYETVIDEDISEATPSEENYSAKENNESFSLKEVSGDYSVLSANENYAVMSTLGSKKTKTASKTTSYKNVAGKVLWSVKVTGTFSYNGKSSSCKKSKVTASAPSSQWSIKSKSSYKSGNTAKATATAVKRIDGTETQKMKKSVSLSCSKKGNLY